MICALFNPHDFLIIAQPPLFTLSLLYCITRMGQEKKAQIITPSMRKSL